MKQLIQSLNRFQLQRRPATTTIYFSQKAFFATSNNNSGPGSSEDRKSKFLMIEKEYFQNLPDNERKYYEAFRLSLIKSLNESWNEPTNWWNRLKNMSKDEIEVLPNEYVKKFSSFVKKVQESQLDAHVDKNKATDMYRQIKDLDHLLTNEEKKAIEDKKDIQREAITEFQYTPQDYMKRQPRYDLSKHNYNFEQFKEFTSIYDEAKKKDQEELRQFYKMVKYSRVNADKGDKRAVSFAKKFRLDLIEIPEEFKEEPIDDIQRKQDKRTRRPFIRIRTNRDLTNYDAWRVFDRELLKGGGKQAGIRKIKVAPALLIKAFGVPLPTRTGFDGTGEYDFEDNNLDIFNIADYKKTDFYWGFNREDEYYDRDLKLPPHRRRRKWPSIKEFWASMEPHEFKLSCQEHADFRKFRLWLYKHLAEFEGKEKSYDQEAQEKFGKEFDICLANYDEPGKVNTKVAVFNWDFTFFMAPEEVKKLKEKPIKVVAPKSFDFSKAERVFITKEELKQRELLEQEKLKDI